MMFIVIEGLDGAGKSTQAELLDRRLTQEGYRVFLTKEPTNNEIGTVIRAALTGKWKPSNRVLQLLFAADRGDHLEREILPALKKGIIVISDRYYFSSLAYGSLGLDLAWLKALNQDYAPPDIGFFIHISAQTALKRMQASRQELELFEKEKELQKVAEAYAEFLTKDSVFISLDGEQSVEEIHEQIYQKVLKNIS